MNDTHFINALGIDENIVEKEAFTKYENHLGAFMKGLEKLNPHELLPIFIGFDKARFFIRGILSLKKRNPSVINSAYNQDALKEFFDKQIVEIDAKLEEEISCEDRQEWENMKISYSDPKTIGTDFLSISLLLEDSDEGWIEGTESMLFKPWHIYNTAPDKPFITSDNPGFFVDRTNDHVYNTHFSEGVQFFFPLSPVQCFCVRLDKPSVPLTLKKEIINQTIHEWGIDYINACTLGNANKYIYGKSERELIDTATYLKSQTS